MIMVPSINRTALDAANFVEYMNSPADGTATNPNGGIDWAERRAANGHPAPYRIRTWEYGNEPYLGGQRYWRAADADERARQFVQGGWQRQTGDLDKNDDGLFVGCDLLNRKKGTGSAGQTYRTRYRPVAFIGDSTAESGPIAAPVLQVNGVEWKRLDSIAASGPNDRVFTLDRASGTIRFGDGVHGAIPPAGASLSIDYTTGRQDGFLDYQQAMKAVDPTIQLCAGYAKPEFIAAMGNRPYDCLAVHSYTYPGGGDAGGAYTTEELYNNLMRTSVDPTNELRSLRTRLATAFPNASQRPELIVTEYGTLNGGNAQLLPKNYQAMLMHNLYLSSLLVGQIQNGVGLSINSNLNTPAAADPADQDWSQLLASPPGFAVTGRAKALALASALIGQQPKTLTFGGNPNPTGTSYPALVGAATCTGGVERIFVVNRDRTAGVPIDLGATGVTSGTVTTVTATDVTAYNTSSRTPVTSTQKAVAVSGGSASSVLPPHSTNLVELRIGSGGQC